MTGAEFVVYLKLAFLLAACVFCIWLLGWALWQIKCDWVLGEDAPPKALDKEPQP